MDIISAIPEAYKTKLLPLLKAKPVRTASGIMPVAVMSKPHRCPHIATTGNICIYCPGVFIINNFSYKIFLFYIFFSNKGKFLFSFSYFSLYRDQTQISNTLLKVTLVMSPQV